MSEFYVSDFIARVIIIIIMMIFVFHMSVIVAPEWMPMECTALCVRERLAKHPDITLSMT